VVVRKEVGCATSPEERYVKGGEERHAVGGKLERCRGPSMYLCHLCVCELLCLIKTNTGESK